MATRLILPEPPDPDDQQYARNSMKWQRDLFRILLDWRGKIEQASRPTIAGPMVVSTFTTTTNVTGTTTGTDLSNAFCTLIEQLTNASYVSPTISRGGST